MATTAEVEPQSSEAASEQGRELHLANPLMKGPDVAGAQRLLLENPYGTFDCGTPDGEYGPATAAATKHAKFALGYPLPDVNEVFGSGLRAYLSNAQELPIDYQNRRKAREHAVTGDALIRRKIVEFAKWGCANEPKIHYAEVRPMNGLDAPQQVPLTTDCSGFATCCYKWAGGPDPNGRDFNGAGWTGDMINNGRHIAKSALKPGDLVVFGGPAARQHVCIVIEPGADPMLVSHGQEKGPFAVSFSAEAQAHSGQPVHWLAYLH
jgi:cell wall-associated NlpC family hydrolase